MANDSQEHRSTAQAASSKLPLGIFFIVAVGAMLFWNYYWRPKVALENAASNPAVGQALPLLELQPLTGVTEGVSLESLRGKVAMVNFWGTWCPPCRQEFPHLVELWDRHRGNPDFAFLSVSSSGSFDEDVVSVKEETEKFLKARGTTLPTYIDADGASRRMLASLFGEVDIGYPTTAIIDRHGVVRAVWEGYSSGDERAMERMVSKLLAEK